VAKRCLKKKTKSGQATLVGKREENGLRRSPTPGICLITRLGEMETITTRRTRFRLRTAKFHLALISRPGASG